MKKVLVLVFMMVGMSFGCVAEEQDSLPKEGVSQVQQEVGEPCSANYQCRLGTRCYTSTWTCGSFPVFGPSQNSCIDSLQCQYQFDWDSYCHYNHPQSSYGECLRY